MKLVGRLLGFFLLLGALFALGFSWRDLEEGNAPSMRAVNRLIGVKTAATKLTPDQVFRHSYNQILTEYQKEVEPTDLKYAGITGLMASLGDPHTAFLIPRQAKEFLLETRANFVGVGARLQSDPLGAKVNSVFEDGPAFAGGMKAGDIITAVDDAPVMGLPIDEIVQKVRGTEGSIVRLKLLRPDKQDPVEIRVRRAQIITPTVEARLIEGTKIGYLALVAFSEPTPEQFDRALDRLEGQGMEGLIIDLRNNPGGLLETSVHLLSRFVEDKVVVRMKFRGGKTEVAKTYSRFKRDFRYPITVLINEESASAAEIFAGALQDYGLATLVGTHSYGKASVQNVFELIDGSSAKITIARYFLPNGTDIGRKVDENGIYLSGGLKPNVEQPLDLSKDPVIGDPKSDTQLQKAMELIQAKTG